MSPAEIKEARMLAQLTQAEAASYVGVDIKTWWRWENGRSKMPYSAIFMISKWK